MWLSLGPSREYHSSIALPSNGRCLQSHYLATIKHYAKSLRALHKMVSLPQIENNDIMRSVAGVEISK
jgi:hypothetical protein